jgi:hypothetical protein
VVGHGDNAGWARFGGSLQVKENVRMGDRSRYIGDWRAYEMVKNDMDSDSEVM